MFVILPIAAGIFYTIVTFSSAHCKDFECKDMKTPVKFEQVAKGERYSTK